MSGEVGIEALKAHAAARSERKRQDVLAVVKRLAGEGGELSVANVARQAQVSREFVYSHADLIAAVRAAVDRARTTATDAATKGAVTASQAADRRVLALAIDREKKRSATLRAQVEELRAQREEWLGQQLEGFDAADPEMVAELRAANERLMAENARLTGTLAEQRRVIATLEQDLAASREAHADAMAERATDQSIVPLRRRK